MLIPAEFALATACCRHNFAAIDPADIRKLARAVDWPAFVRLVRFHRVQGLVWRSLKSLLQEIPEGAIGLANDAEAILATNLGAALESRDLLIAFEARGIDALVVKGLTLGILAYGDIVTKSGVDIDILVPPGKLAEAARLMADRGYRCVEPAGAFDIGRVEQWHGVRKESVWVDYKRRLQVDLHTALADSALLIPTIGLYSPRQKVEVAQGIALPTLGPDELLTYLSVHGASSAWFRLKWVTDFAAMLHQLDRRGIERFHRRSAELRAGRAPNIALLLADAVYGALDGLPELRRKIARDRVSRRLSQRIFRRLARRHPVEPTSRALGTLFIHAAQFALVRGLRAKLLELGHQWRLIVN